MIDCILVENRNINIKQHFVLIELDKFIEFVKHETIFQAISKCNLKNSKIMYYVSLVKIWNIKKSEIKKNVYVYREKDHLAFVIGPELYKIMISLWLTKAIEFTKLTKRNIYIYNIHVLTYLLAS